MGRLIVADDRVEKTISELWCGPQKTCVGLLFGQQTQQKDYIVHIARTPVTDDRDSCSDGDGDATRTAGRTDAAPAISLSSVDDTWVASHAKQALRMLPGGLSVVGIFAMAPPEEMNQAQMKLKQVLYSVDKVIRRSGMQTESENDINQRILLQICPTTRKFSCRTYDSSDNKSGASPVEWRFQSLVSRWLQLDSRLAMDIMFTIPRDMSSQTIYKQIQNGLLPFCDNIHNAMTLIDDCFISAEMQLATTESHSEKGGKKGRKQKANRSQAGESQKLTVHLLTNMAPSDSCADPKVTECTAKMFVRGAICGRAFVHNKATAEEASKYLKEDFVRSLLSRCELLCEDLLQTEEQQDPKVLYEAPVRVFSDVPGTPLSFCDYIFQDEKPSDSVERFKELTDLDITPDELEMDCEHVPTEEELLLPMKELGSSTESLDMLTDKSNSYCNILGFATAGMVAALAAGISYLYLQ